MRKTILSAGRWAAALALLLLPVDAIHAQTSGAALNGRVLDQSGGALPGATVTATSTTTGFTRSQTTASDGAYRFPGLPADVYNVKADLSGFKSVEQKGVVLNVATTRSVDFSMGVAGVAEEIEVTTEAPLIQSSAAIGTVVSQEELESLPLNGRQFANLGALAPGTQLAYNSDPTKPGQLTVALNGGIGRNVNYVIDGGDNTDDTIGGALQNFSIETVQEFNIQTQQYKAEYGRSTGGVLTVVTKTGTNDFHGSLFGYGRTEGLATESETESIAGSKQPYDRKQFGASLGGPIVKDKAHFFASYERTNKDTSYTINTPLLAENGESIVTPLRDDLFAAKATYDIDAKQYLQVRFGYQKNTDKYGQTPTTAPSALGTVANKYHSILAGHTWTVGNGSLNEFVFQYTKFANAITPDTVLPTLNYPNGVTSGQNFNTPQTTNQKKFQFKDDFSFSKVLGGQRHDFKTGFNFVHEPTLGGDFSTGVDAPTFNLLRNEVGSPVQEIVQSGGLFVNSTPVDQYSIYFQDDWRPTDRLTLNLGLRYDYWSGFDLDQRSNPVYQTLAANTRYTEDYLQDFQNGGGGVLENDKNNLGPRIGFAYDLTGEQRSILRGGFGIYHDFPYTNATILFPAAAVQSNYGTVYTVFDSDGIRNPDGSFFQPGDPLPPNQIVGAGDVPIPREIASPTLKTPLSRQASVGYQTEVTEWLGMGVDLTTIDYRNIPFRFRMNPIDPETGARRFPGLAPGTRLWYGKGKADYDGINFNVRARMTKKLTMQGFYTLSRVKGNVLAGADEFRVYNNDQPDAPTNQPPSITDPLCDACFGPLGTDARHKVTLSGTYTMPYAINVSGMLRARSARPYTVYAQADTNGDGYAQDLAAGVDHVNSERGHMFSQFDLRLAKEFKFGGSYGIEGLFEVFNLFNTKNPASFTSDGVATAFAGDPGQGEQRLAQWGLRFRF